MSDHVNQISNHQNIDVTPTFKIDANHFGNNVAASSNRSASCPNTPQANRRTSQLQNRFLKIFTRKSPTPLNSPPPSSSQVASSRLPPVFANAEVATGLTRIQIRTVEIMKRPGQSLGFYIRQGNGMNRTSGIFISRLAEENVIKQQGLLNVGDEILAVNNLATSAMKIDDVVYIMSISKKLLLTVRTNMQRDVGDQAPINTPTMPHHQPLIPPPQSPPSVNKKPTFELKSGSNVPNFAESDSEDDRLLERCNRTASSTLPTRNSNSKSTSSPRVAQKVSNRSRPRNKVAETSGAANASSSYHSASLPRDYKSPYNSSSTMPQPAMVSSAHEDWWNSPLNLTRSDIPPVVQHRTNEYLTTHFSSMPVDRGDDANFLPYEPTIRIDKAQPQRSVSGFLWLHLLSAAHLDYYGERINALSCMIKLDGQIMIKTDERKGVHEVLWNEAIELRLRHCQKITFLLCNPYRLLYFAECSIHHLLHLIHTSAQTRVAVRLKPRGVLYIQLVYRSTQRVHSLPPPQTSENRHVQTLPRNLPSKSSPPQKPRVARPISLRDGSCQTEEKVVSWQESHR